MFLIPNITIKNEEFYNEFIEYFVWLITNPFEAPIEGSYFTSQKKASHALM